MYSEYTRQQIISFFNRYGTSITVNITDTGLYFPAVMGQLSMESKWGQSDLSSRYNNFGGIKSTGSQFSSGTIMMDTTEYIGGIRQNVKQPFATYTDFDKFMKDYIRILRLPNYVNAGVYNAVSPEEQVLAIAKGGYSTADPQRYLNDCRGRIEAVRDEYKCGLVSSKVSEPTEAEPLSAAKTMEMLSTGSYMDSIVGSVLKTIVGSAADKIK